jgi:hypothetical protein
MWALWESALFALFQLPCGRVLCVHREVSVHIVFGLSKMFKHVARRTMLLMMPVVQTGGSQVATPPRENRSWGILSDFLDCLDLRDWLCPTFHGLIAPEHARCSKTAGLT